MAAFRHFARKKPRVSAAGSTGFWQSVFDLLFGYDYFIAHRSVDGKPFAAALYDALTAKGNELDCFLDVKHYGAGGNLPWMQSRALKKTSRLLVVVTKHAHDPKAHYLLDEIAEFRRHHPHGTIVSIGTQSTLRQKCFPDSILLQRVPNLDHEDICILEERRDLLAGKVSARTVAKLLNDFTEQRNSAKRLKWIKGIAAAMFLLALAASAFGLIAVAARIEAERRSRFANAQRLAAEAKAVADVRPTTALLLAVEAVRATLPDEPRAPAAEDTLRSILSRVGGRALHLDGYVGESNTLEDAAVSSDGRWVVARGKGGAVHLWDLQSNGVARQLCQLEGDTTTELGFTHDSQRAIVVTNTRVRLWQLDDLGKAPLEIPLSERHRVLRPDGRHFDAIADSKGARRFDLSAVDPLGSVIHWKTNVPPSLKAEDINWDGTMSIERDSEGSGASLCQWDGDGLSTLSTEIKDPFFLKYAFGGDGHHVVTGTGQFVDVIALNPQGPAVSKRTLETEGNIVYANLSPNNRWLAAGSYPSGLSIWDLKNEANGKPLAFLKCYEHWVKFISFSVDSRWLVAGTANEIRIWDLQSEQWVASPLKLKGHSHQVKSVAFSPGGRWLLSGDAAGSVRLWDVLKSPRSEAFSVANPGKPVSTVAFSQNCELMMAGERGQIRIWSYNRVAPSLENPRILADVWVFDLAISPNAKDLAVVARSPEAWEHGFPAAAVSIWDLEKAEPATDPTVLMLGPGEMQKTWVARYGDAGQALYTAGGKELRATGMIRKWSIDRGQKPVRVETWEGHTSRRGILCLALSRDKQLMASGTDDGAALWDISEPAKAGEAPRSPSHLLPHDSPVQAVALSVDGRLFATASGTTARLFDIEAESQKWVPVLLSAHQGSVQAVEISPDLRWCATGGGGEPPHQDTFGELYLWPLRLEELIDLARPAAGRNLTPGEWERYFPRELYRSTFASFPVPQDSSAGLRAIEEDRNRDVESAFPDLVAPPETASPRKRDSPKRPAPPSSDGRKLPP